jgi:[acyl-carrier-protein] S-malonyltransferase
VLAFVLPDHGAEWPGMGDAWAAHESWELVDLASEAAGRDVAALLTVGGDDLDILENAHLATFVLSIVALDAAERLGLAPMAVAGYGLGEYAALVTSGALDFESGVRLVVERAVLAREALGGSELTTVTLRGLTDDDVEVACARAEGDAWVAGYDAPDEVVVTGRPEGVEQAIEIARTFGSVQVAPCLPSGGFHTPLVAGARESMRKLLASVSFSELDPVVVANVDARHHPDASEWPGLLSAQLSAPVRWRQSVDALYDDGVRTFVEFGAGGVLAERIARTFARRTVQSHSIATPHDLESLMDRLVSTSRRTITSHEQVVGRFVVSPATGPFEPAANISYATPQLAGIEGEAEAPTGEVELHVGDLIGWVGDVEVRSAFDGTLGGLLVIAGERVMSSQPLAWLRAGTAA